MPRRAILILTLGSALLLVALLATYWFAPAGRENAGGSGTADIGGDFRLVNQFGKVVTQKDLSDRLLLVYFGFTYCPDICPTELQNMSLAMDQLGDQGDQIQPLFITIDPERDTVDVMRDYAAHFHPRLLALTGTAEEIAAAAGAYRVYYRKIEDASASEYLMDHSTFVYLMDKKGHYLRHFSKGTSPEKMAEGMRAFL